ncbi:hypothetical protein GOARA_012_00270 [Gordonia araii NBRC 100433]|uniref:Mce-associated membrane protein n=1 Tax=Gordonia araii NBRC 100433 TaxID=1073574 RepID=G7GY02_9ACTN|nr:hypothetical protein [Gordonia araii]NNG98088.1 hypothetical protein [Gordonia araii NBRC 100433]GAB08477.1 hypothetical protein GOARA_012_00270 [Gordonia araii NBRC 100433]
MANDDERKTGPAKTSPIRSRASAAGRSRDRRPAAEGKRDPVVLARLCAVLAALCLLLGAATVVLAVGRSSAAADLARQEQRVDDNRARLTEARKVAGDYATRSLTIDYKQAAQYVQGLQRGTTAEFAKNFSTEQGGAGLLTQELLQQLRMVSEGKVLYTHFDGDADAPPADGQPWNFVVVATQTATTTQQPEKSTNAVILRVVVVRSGGEWKIANFSPDPKIQGGGAIPGAN